MNILTRWNLPSGPTHQYRYLFIYFLAKTNKRNEKLFGPITVRIVMAYRLLLVQEIFLSIIALSSRFKKKWVRFFTVKTKKRQTVFYQSVLSAKFKAFYVILNEV